MTSSWYLMYFAQRNIPLFQRVTVTDSVLCLVAQLCPTDCNPVDCSPPGSSVHGNSPSKNTGMGCHALLKGIFPTQGSNPGLLHCRWILYHLSHQGNHFFPYINTWNNFQGSWLESHGIINLGKETSKSACFCSVCQENKKSLSKISPFFSFFKLLLSYSRKLNLNVEPSFVFYFPLMKVLTCIRSFIKCVTREECILSPDQEDDHPVENQSGMWEG